MQGIDKFLSNGGFGARFGDYELRARYRQQLFSQRNIPVHVMLVVDSSGSMRGEPTSAVIESVEEIATWLGGFADSMSMWTFNDKVLHKMRPTHISKVDMTRLRQDLTKYVQGSTRLNDALYTVCKNWDTTKLYKCAKFIVLLTDGGDNNSKFTVGQVQRELANLSLVFDKFIFLTAGCCSGTVSYLQSLLKDVPSSKYTIKSANTNGRDNIKLLFSHAQAIIEEVVVEYYHKGKQTAYTKFVAFGGNQKENLAHAALADINHKMKGSRMRLEYLNT